MTALFLDFVPMSGRLRHAAPLMTLLAGLTLLFGACGDDKTGDEVCQPATVEQCPENSCGSWGDGCEGSVDCGTCDGEDQVCGSDGFCGTKAIGGCVRKTCRSLGSVCGADFDDGCGGRLTCGCEAPNSCVSGTCSCTPFTCDDLGNPSGEAYDGCGHFIQCSGSGGSTERVRILAGNLTTSGALTTSSGTSVTFSETWDPGHGQRILQGLKPKVALLQEFKTLLYEYERTGYWQNSAASLRDFVSTTFGDRYYAYRENRSGMKMGKPNGIVSYYPIKSAGEFPSALANVQDRQHVWARIDLPGDRDLWVVSVHLYTGSNASDFGMTETGARDAEMEALIANLRSLQIPAGDYLVIGGDYNISSRSERCMNTLRDSGLISVDSNSTCPVDQSGNGDTNANRNEPYDLVLANSALKAHQVRPDFSGASGLDKDGLVFDSRKFSPLSAVSPVQRNDSGATDMQHMAVLKDFAVPR